MNELEQLIPFKEMTEGQFLGLLHVPTAGFDWVEKAEPLITGAKRDPSDGRLKATPLPYALTKDPGPWLVSLAGLGWSWSIRRYPVMKKAGLHRLFANLRPTETSIRTFANKYGLLRQGVALGQPGDSSKWMGESLTYWTEHLATVGALLRLWDLVQLEDTTELSTYVLWTRDPLTIRIDLAYGDHKLHREPVRKMREGTYDSKAMREQGILQMVGGTIADERSGFAETELLSRWEQGDVKGPARYYVHREINRAMKGHVSPAVLPFHRSEIHFSPDSLLSAIYVHFAMELSGSDRPLIPCKRQSCDQYFVQYHRRQKFHDEACRKLANYHKRKQSEEGGDG